MSNETASIMCPYQEDVKLLGQTSLQATLGTSVIGSEANSVCTELLSD
jgi:hypothetical protein